MLILEENIIFDIKKWHFSTPSERKKVLTFFLSKKYSIFQLVNSIREAIDRKQENMRRRRRRDALRLQLVRVFDMAARQGHGFISDMF